MIKLGINIDHVATLRQARRGIEPDVVEAARCAEAAGADGITIHLREDRRHIQDRDVEQLRTTRTTKLNLEMAVYDEIIAIACRVKPDDVCLVPEKREELTTEGGLDVVHHEAHVRHAVEQLKRAGICVSIFIDPREEQILAAQRVGADAVELHTGCYANAVTNDERAKQLQCLTDAAQIVGREKLILNAGHGLNYENVVPVAQIKGMHELNIGHSIIARAVFVGLGQAVREMKELIRQ